MSDREPRAGCLCMRRTLFRRTPRAGPGRRTRRATRTIAARERPRLEADDRGTARFRSGPAAWLARASAAALRFLEEHGEAFTSGSREGGAVPSLGKRLSCGRKGLPAQTTQKCGVEGAPPARGWRARVVRGRPRGTWTSGRYRWVRTAPGAGRRGGGLETGKTHRPSSSAAGWAPSGRDGDRPGLVGRLDGPRGTGRARRRPARGSRFGRCDRATSSPTTREPTDARSRPLHSCRRSTPPRWAGSSATGTSGRPGPVLFDSNGNAGPTVWWDGRVVGGWSQQKKTGRSSSGCWDVGAEAVSSVQAEVERVEAGSARCASHRVSCRRSSES